MNRLGRGGYGTVYRARCFNTPDREYAIKVVQRGYPKPDSHRQEVEFHTHLRNHPNIVTFRGHLGDETNAYLIMDFVSGGDLGKAITKKRIFARNDALVKRLFLQLLDAVQACHNAGIYHCDLKPDNVLINKEMNEVYLTDFGLSTSSPKSRYFGVGTASYMSPECLNASKSHRAYDTKRADIWALGIILINMLSGRNPWSRAKLSDPRYKSFLENEEYLRELLPISAEASSLLRKVLQHNEEDSIDLATFRKLVEDVDTFYMSEEEIENAEHYARVVATEYLRPISKEPTPPLAAQLIEVDRDWSEGVPYFVSLGVRDSSSSSPESGHRGGDEFRLGLPRQEAISLVAVHSVSNDRVAWGRDKTVPMHMRAYSFRGSSEESALSGGASESGTCSIGGDNSSPDPRTSTRRIGRPFSRNADPKGMGSTRDRRRETLGSIEIPRFRLVTDRQTALSRLTSNLRRLFGIME
ncbi:hypothetical protein NLI96_g9456 [Meripilus lineatus]|uniref:Protein kinase domain-containing protein n=1 Tax=Meripilus lineatus TaxID=2056292 RepID=A0AAD5YF97_9APHY|nr:hypothetical protein NLI96_g9456 [Physisporinus lineatus]